MALSNQAGNLIPVTKEENSLAAATLTPLPLDSMQWHMTSGIQIEWRGVRYRPSNKRSTPQAALHCPKLYIHALDLFMDSTRLDSFRTLAKLASPKDMPAYIHALACGASLGITITRTFDTRQWWGNGIGVISGSKPMAMYVMAKYVVISVKTGMPRANSYEILYESYLAISYPDVYTNSAGPWESIL
jgi:hypothetical protein